MSWEVVWIYIISILNIASVIGAIIVTSITKKDKDYTYTRLDKAGVITNILLIVISLMTVIPLFITCLIGFVVVETNDTTIRILLNSSLMLGHSLPFLTSMCLSASAVLRKKGKSKLSFAIQFLSTAVCLLDIVILNIIIKYV